MKKMFTACLIVMSAFCLTACEKTTESVDDIFVMPEGMKDCKAYKMSSGSGTILYVVRCPLSTTSTTKTGKTPVRAIVTETQENLEDLPPPEPPKAPKEKMTINGKTFVEE